MARKYERSGFLASAGVSQSDYEKWLRRIAAAHLKRDRKRGNTSATGESYRLAIHDAVKASKGMDAYTGEKLHWGLLSKWDNKTAKERGREYKKEFALQPSIDHIDDGMGLGRFRICGWRTNDAKSDLTDKEFCELCALVIKNFCKSK